MCSKPAISNRYFFFLFLRVDRIPFSATILQPFPPPAFPSSSYSPIDAREHSSALLFRLSPLSFSFFAGALCRCITTTVQKVPFSKTWIPPGAWVELGSSGGTSRRRSQGKREEEGVDTPGGGGPFSPLLPYVKAPFAAAAAAALPLSPFLVLQHWYGIRLFKKNP